MKCPVHQMTKFFAMVALTGILTGCIPRGALLFCAWRHHNNGEGYCGKRASDEGENPELQGPVVPDEFKNATSYVWVQPGYRCVNNNGETIESYRDLILVGQSEFLQKGDQCTSEPLRRAPKTELEIDGSLLGYGAGIYQRK